ncbi:MAG: Ribosomal RNA small subunit methyltransferase H [Candidatus Nomurabacteria bacterium GW2011_GWF1_31_48]|uniref:Ribosomal RNA small subunit methyltransferase H n=1 Tax=Candidatus Nomurabacteria bacterium GW2011_GWF1_31_48 TaxID=1618767 RepID=A0A0G0BDT6_9BACT|nr:MAG: Ribosomal RNA small subunit methyltransferase H [Candidatus Nomurabacteria bacterium GW2011_GWF1_31_48]
MTNTPRHFSAFRGEIAKLFELTPGKVFYDLTLGDGGHTQEALEAGCRVISFDVDPEAVVRATSFITNLTPEIVTSQTNEIDPDFKWLIINDNFVKITEYVNKLKLPLADGIMVDLGPSQFQVLSPERGFSFLSEEPLDMRLTKDLGVTAADLINALNEGELASLLQLGDEPFARPLARAIVKVRQQSRITTTKQLSDLILRVKGSRQGKVHPATKTFMALRMAVNLEREVIQELLPQLPSLLNPEGIVGVISFHSGEDKLVKDFMKDSVENNLLSAINKKPLTPSQEELKISTRTRSAKLRLARKII